MNRRQLSDTVLQNFTNGKIHKSVGGILTTVTISSLSALAVTVNHYLSNTQAIPGFVLS